MAEVKSNLELLKAEGVCVTEDITDITEEEKSVIERLTDEEVKMLIRLRKNLGRARKGREKIRPCFPL